MGIKKATKLLDWLREQQKEVPTKFHTTTDKECKTNIEEDLRTMLMLVTFRDMYKILEALAEPDKIGKGELKIPKGQQADWAEEFGEDQVERDAAYRQGFQEGYEHGRKGGVPPPTPPTPATEFKEREEPPAFGVGDTVEIQWRNKFFASITQIATSGASFKDTLNNGGFADYTNIKLLFPLSRVLKELKLPNGKTIHCEPRGDIVEMEDGIIGMIVCVAYEPRLLFFDAKSNDWQSELVGAKDIKRIIWRMEESK